MPLSEFELGAIICSEGEPISNFMFLTKGTAEALFSGFPFCFEKGDMIGVCDLCKGSYSFTYTAISDVTVFTYPFRDFSSVDALLSENADVANLLISSMCRQISDSLKYKSVLKREANQSYGLVNDIYTQYENLCKLYAVKPKKLLGMTGIAQFSEADPVADWLHDYYLEINALDPAARNVFFHGKPGISSGFLRRAAGDFIDVLEACRVYQEYTKSVSRIFLNTDEFDLFAMISDLHFNSIIIKGADEAVGALMKRLTGLLSNMTGVDPVYLTERQNSYSHQLVMNRTLKEITDAPSVPGMEQNFSNPLDLILDYSEYPEDVRNKFIRFVQDYTKLPERNSSDDDSRRLRKELTDIFNKIYQNVFIKSLRDDSPSTIIKMFLNFGYIDATLAGQENADYLFQIADTFRGDPSLGVYTFPEWLTAIYNGEKEPSRNEFDQDYNDYIHDKKVRREIDEKEEAQLLADIDGKLRFEIENVFPIVNKITFGHITTFTPLFADHNVMRKLDVVQVTPALLKEAFDEVRSLDFSAYYREALYSNPECGIPRESINIEILPDIILMPNIGTRGVMWQEIEGKKRSTPSRMFISVFLENDLKAMAIQLTGEYRWEMCKRVQGARWNDFSEPSLTSGYSDYLQFYKKNSELSQEARDLIKNDLSKARNNHKMVFAANYAVWLQAESKGSPRLNKIARKILSEYCPFPASIRETLMQNPRYTELLTKYNFKQGKRAKHMSSVIQKVVKAGKPTPQELIDELEYAKR